jgi:hypothetical protein
MSADKHKADAGTVALPGRRASVFRPAHRWCAEVGIRDERDQGWRSGQLLLDAMRVLNTGRALDRTVHHLWMRKLLEEDFWKFYRLLNQLEKTYKGVV